MALHYLIRTSLQGRRNMSCDATSNRTYSPSSVRSASLLLLPLLLVLLLVLILLLLLPRELHGGGRAGWACGFGQASMCGYWLGVYSRLLTVVRTPNIQTPDDRPDPPGHRLRPSLLVFLLVLVLLLLHLLLVIRHQGAACLIYGGYVAQQRVGARSLQGVQSAPRGSVGKRRRRYGRKMLVQQASHSQKRPSPACRGTLTVAALQLDGGGHRGDGKEEEHRRGGGGARGLHRGGGTGRGETCWWQKRRRGRGDQGLGLCRG
jgi:hypothetical protein